MDSIIAMEQAENLLVAISELIHSLAIDSLHIIGDIFDRGPGAVKIMEELLAAGKILCLPRFLDAEHYDLAVSEDLDFQQKK